jgi:hypothetical protein
MNDVDRHWTYEEYRERLDAWIRKYEQRIALKAKRTERKQIKQARGGKAVASLLLKPITRKQT